MALFDFLTGEDRIPGTEGFERGIGEMTAPAVPEVQQPQMSRTEAFFSDPNMQRLLAEMGGRFSQGQPAGQAIGAPTSALVRRQAAQKGGESLMNQILEALRKDPTGAGLLGPKEDLGTLDSINITDGGITLKAPNASKTQPFQIPGEQKALEGIESIRPPEDLTLRTGLTAGLPGGVTPTPAPTGREPIVPPQPRRPEAIADRGQDLRDFFNAPIV